MKLLYLALNPIQNAKPYRLLNSMPGISYLVAYLKRPDEQLEGKENLNKAAFSHDLTEGYNHCFLQNKSPFKRRGGFFSNFHPKAFSLVSQHDVAVIYGHHTLTFLLALFWARLTGTKAVLTTDATYIEANDESGGLKLKIKPFLLRLLYNHLAHGVFVPSAASSLFLQSQGIKPERIQVTPYVVDEDLILGVSGKTDRRLMRVQLGLHEDDFVFVLCAKLISRKRPQDAVLALAGIADVNVKLLIIGTGPEEAVLKKIIEEKGLRDRVLFTGLIPYTELAKYYTLSDALVFCSDHEPYGLPVNEAMLCGIPVVVSDRIGARLDLVEEEITGYTYSCGDVEQLSAKMKQMADDPVQCRKMGVAAKQKMSSWSSQTNVDRQMSFFRKKGWIRAEDRRQTID